jgi:CHASE2 domain-containing sensor protein
VSIAQRAVKILTALSRRPALLGLAIVLFALSGTVLVVVSALVAGWWRDFTMGLGTSLLLTGTVEIGVLGVLRRRPEQQGAGALKCASTGSSV